MRFCLPYVIKYNAEKPSKFAAFPQYESYKAPERYAEIARFLGLPAATTEEGVAKRNSGHPRLGARSEYPFILERGRDR